MKKILASLLFAACLGFAGNACAAVQEFGPDFARFVIDVKDWTPTATPNGASFLSADKSCNVVIAVDKNGGQNAEAIAKAIAQQAGMSDAQEVAKDADTYTTKGTIQGKETMITVSVEGEKFVCVSITGDLQKGADFIDTLDEKK
ncbi:MAG: hypothetical protein II132_01940 [Desulfovibrio sp.]|nr:hypothetical protein [Desulfovibrio sp.]MBQ1844696.1 hypothetical protein [Desulfovibrio sp.]MBQ2475724.1 hypothetical protein [Desulfovibrio sp.]